jgi:hypothetical protein
MWKLDFKMDMKVARELFSEEVAKQGKVSGKQWLVWGDKYDQSTLYTCTKMSE